LTRQGDREEKTPYREKGFSLPSPCTPNLSLSLKAFKRFAFRPVIYLLLSAKKALLFQHEVLKFFGKGFGEDLFFKAGCFEQVSKPPHDAAIKETCDKTRFSPTGA